MKIINLYSTIVLSQNKITTHVDTLQIVCDCLEKLTYIVFYSKYIIRNIATPEYNLNTDVT